MAIELKIVGVTGLPEVQIGDDIASLLVESGAVLENGDILVVTQKIVSKSEGRIVRLTDIVPSDLALTISNSSNKDPRLLEVILSESERIVRMDHGNLICETRHGFKCANAGVDSSNVPGQDCVALLPISPDESAARIRADIKRLTNKVIAVIISDSFGRPWREGAVDVAIGVSGMTPLKDYRGVEDVHGRAMTTTSVAMVDELASAAEVAMGKIDRVPVAIIRGVPYKSLSDDAADTGAKGLVRPPEKDLFR